MAEDSSEAIAMVAITLPFVQDYPAPNSENASDQYPSALPRHFIDAYTAKGARVFDPFMGFGTTAFVAEDMGRVPYGVEANGERFEWGAGQLKHWQNIRHGDSVEISEFDFPQMDFCITSPPWMPMQDDWNPLYGGDPQHNGYLAYLTRMDEIFVAVRSVMKDGACVVVHVSDIDNENGFTPLVADIKAAISRSFRFTEDVMIEWDQQGQSTHCLVFKAV